MRHDQDDYCEVCDGMTTETTWKIFLRTTFALGWLLFLIGAGLFDPTWLLMALGLSAMFISVLLGDIL